MSWQSGPVMHGPDAARQIQDSVREYMFSERWVEGGPFKSRPPMSDGQVRGFELTADVFPETIFSGLTDCTKAAVDWCDGGGSDFVYFEDQAGGPICFGVGWSPASSTVTGTRGYAIQRGDGVWIVIGGQFETGLPARKLAGGSGVDPVALYAFGPFELGRIVSGSISWTGHQIQAMNLEWLSGAMGLSGNQDPAWVDYCPTQRTWYCPSCNAT